MARPMLPFLFPNSFPLLRQQQQCLRRNLLRASAPTQQCRPVTGSTVAKPGAGSNRYEVPQHRLVTKEQLSLGMPDKYRPPSHGRRLKEHVPRNYGPELTREQKAVQGTKRYPNSMPAEGTWMYWFLTCKQLHAYIALVSTPFVSSGLHTHTHINAQDRSVNSTVPVSNCNRLRLFYHPEHAFLPRRIHHL